MKKLFIVILVSCFMYNSPVQARYKCDILNSTDSYNFTECAQEFKNALSHSGEARQKAYRDKIEKADKFFQKGDYFSAADYYKYAFEYQPTAYSLFMSLQSYDLIYSEASQECLDYNNEIKIDSTAFDQKITIRETIESLYKQSQVNPLSQRQVEHNHNELKCLNKIRGHIKKKKLGCTSIRSLRKKLCCQ